MMNKKRLFMLFFGIIFFPKTVFAAVPSYEYVDKVSSLTIEEKENIVNNITSSNSYKNFIATGRKYIILYACDFYESTYVGTEYVVRLDSVEEYNTILASSGQIMLSPAGYNLFFDKDFNFLGSKTTYPLYFSDFSIFYNNLIASEVPVVFNASFNLVNGETVLKEITSGMSMQDLVVEEAPTFEENTLYELSIKILGTIPEEFEWCYLVMTYLLGVICGVVVISPFILVIKLLGGVF